MEIDPLGTEIYTAAELADRIGTSLRSEFPDTVMVQGEVSDLKRSQPGHVYFNLIEPAEPGKQSTASLPVALFNSNKQTVNTILKRANVGRIQDGMPLRIRTSVDFYAARGTLTLAMSGVDPTFTLDFLSSERERLLQQLISEGLDKPNGQLPMPPSPRRIGLVTSVGSAAYADFTDELKQSGFSWDVLVADCRVQGQDAEQAIVAAIKTLTNYHDVELIAVIRGGGSRGDLSTFDSEPIARTIAKCAVPVLTGIGHEIDTSIADVVSHSAYKTPTAVAVALNERVADALNRAEQFSDAIASTTMRKLAEAEAQLTTKATSWAINANRSVQTQQLKIDRLATAVPQAAGHKLRNANLRVDTADREITRSTQRTTKQQQARLAALETSLTRHSLRPVEQAERHLTTIENQVRALDPQRTLARGWSITRTEDGTVLRDPNQAEPGTKLVTTVADGEVTSTVTP